MSVAVTKNHYPGILDKNSKTHFVEEKALLVGLSTLPLETLGEPTEQPKTALHPGVTSAFPHSPRAGPISHHSASRPQLSLSS